MIRTIRFVNRASATTAIIVRLDFDEEQVAFPVFEYKDQNGTIYNFKGEIGASPPSYRIGQKVSILYHSSRPFEMKRNTFWNLYWKSILCLFLSALFLVIGFSV